MKITAIMKAMIMTVFMINPTLSLDFVKVRDYYYFQHTIA